MNPEWKADEEADAAYLRLTDREVAVTADLGTPMVHIDYAADGTIIGVEFIGLRQHIAW